MLQNAMGSSEHEHTSTQAPIAGPELAFLEALDRTIAGAALATGAVAYQFAPLVPMTTLEYAGYCASFPHLVTVPATMRESECCQQDTDGAGYALTPAACLPVYAEFACTAFSAPMIVTTRNTCWRREATFEPLRRQWVFNMREVVCIGAYDEVRAFLADWRYCVTGLADALGLGAELHPACDPFFGEQAAQRLFQVIAEAKLELLVDDLALASLNNHGRYFGDAFDLRRGVHCARSACVAFGLERWLFAMRNRHGPDAAGWPSLPSSDNLSEMAK